MASRTDPRRVARLTIPARLRDGDLAHYLVHILDLSPLGVRIAHPEPWRKGVVCAVELPPALGAFRLPGRVVWTRLRAGDDILEGDQRSRYESGVEFPPMVTATAGEAIGYGYARREASGRYRSFSKTLRITFDAQDRVADIAYTSSGVK